MLTLRHTALALALATACNRAPAPAPQSDPAPVAQTHVAQTPVAQAPVAQTPTPAAPAGPRFNEAMPTYALTAALAPSAGATPGSFSLELRGAGEFHVNDQYPISLTLDVTNATMSKREFHRADAAELTQALARFAQPVEAAGPGARVTGHLRFGVCRAEQCQLETREFSLAL